MKCDHIKRMITLTGDNIKRLSLYFYFDRNSKFIILVEEKHEFIIKTVILL